MVGWPVVNGDDNNNNLRGNNIKKSESPRVTCTLLLSWPKLLYYSFLQEKERGTVLDMSLTLVAGGGKDKSAKNLRSSCVRHEKVSTRRDKIIFNVFDYL